MSGMSAYVPIAEAARVSGMSERQIRRWAITGRVPVMSGRRGRLVDLAAVRGLAGLEDGRPDMTGHQWTDPDIPAHSDIAANSGTAEPLPEVRPGPDEAGHLAQLVRELIVQNTALTLRVAALEAENQRLLEATPAGKVESAVPAAQTPRIALQRPWWAFWKPASGGPQPA